MKLYLLAATLLLAPCLLPEAGAQMITMSNACTRLIKDGTEANNARDYQKGFEIFSQVLQQCKARDARDKGNAGYAMSLNGLGRYQEAVTAAEQSMRFSKNRNVTAFYARGMARRKMGDEAGAKADFARVTDMTNRNKNVQQRATIFAEIADLDWQSGMPDDAMNNINAAIALDGNNANFFIQRGDMHFRSGNYDAAFEDYDKAVALGRNDVAMYQLRTEGRLKQYQTKYGTTNANELASKLTASEKDNLCKEIRQARSLGFKNINIDLLANMICN